MLQLELVSDDSVTKPATHAAPSESAEIRDPVCGKAVNPLRARAVGIYAGVTRYFCSQACKSAFADPRSQPGVAPNGVERRASDAAVGTSSGQWFAQGGQPEARAVPERFSDLEEARPATAEVSLSPSLLVEVQASKKSAARYLWLALAVVAGVVLAFIGLR